ncbi:MAG: TIGR00269 family protein [Desulfovibrio sp.]|nr:MAG: TIGR00269 family protein [Desulfovibrio sp.]
MKCRRCKEPAVVALPSHNSGFCGDCFFMYFSRQVDKAIRSHELFSREEPVLVAISGGKDSLALLLELHSQDYQVTGLFVDLGIPDSSDLARAKVEAFCAAHGLDLQVVETAAHGLAIPVVKKAVRRPICAVCGKVKRYYFNKVAMDQNFAALATGHTLDDEAGRLLANTLRWDGPYLSDQGPRLEAENGFARKVKPLFRLTEFETAVYCFLKGIDYHMSGCPYAQGASFPVLKEAMADLEEKRPGQMLSFYLSFLEKGKPAFTAMEKEQGADLAPCVECGYPTSAGTCGVCRIKAQVADAGGI